MRKFLFSIFMIAMVAIGFTVPTEVNAQAPLLYTGEMGPDTVNASETITHWPNGTSFATARRFKDVGNLSVTCKLDSLSGTPNVTTTLWLAEDLAGTIWKPVDTVSTTNMGPAHSKTFQFDCFNNESDVLLKATWFKITHVGSGTQGVKAQDTYAFKRRS